MRVRKTLQTKVNLYMHVNAEFKTSSQHSILIFSNKTKNETTKIVLNTIKTNTLIKKTIVLIKNKHFN